MAAWTDIAMLTLSATLANHMGLVEAAERVIRHRLPVLNCSKCLTFWSVLAYTIATGTPAVASVAISFLAAYAATWLELLLYYMNTLYNKGYENIHAQETDHQADTEDEVS